MDTLACQEYERLIHPKIESAAKAVTFDLAGVGYIASSFLRICLRTAQAVGKENLAISNCAPEIKKVFKIAGLDKQLSIV
jgi:anti-anti-sigma factor